MRYAKNDDEIRISKRELEAAPADVRQYLLSLDRTRELRNTNGQARPAPPRSDTEAPPNVQAIVNELGKIVPLLSQSFANDVMKFPVGSTPLEDLKSQIIKIISSRGNYCNCSPPNSF